MNKRIFFKFGCLGFFFLITGCESRRKKEPRPENQPTQSEAPSSDGSSGSANSGGDVAGSSSSQPGQSSSNPPSELVAPSLSVKVEWMTGPVADDYSTAVLTFFVDEKTPETLVSDVTVTPWMKIHGHGTGDFQPQVKTRDGEPHRFDVTDIYFIMSGPWELNVSAKWNQEIYKFEIPVRVP